MHRLWESIQTDERFNDVSVKWFSTAQEIQSYLECWVSDEDHIVLKASNSMGFSKLIDNIKKQSVI